VEFEVPEEDGSVHSLNPFKPHKAKQQMPKGKTLYLFCEDEA